jgi:hypothetical protein
MNFQKTNENIINLNHHEYIGISLNRSLVFIEHKFHPKIDDVIVDIMSIATNWHLTNFFRQLI